MSLLVVDASAALAWLLPSQATERSSAFIVHLPDFDLIAPAIFEWEVLNILNLYRGRRMSEQGYGGALEALAAANIEVAPAQSPQRLSAFAVAEGLSLFDAAYLDLAKARGAELVSRDEALLTAGMRHHLPVHDLSTGKSA